MTRIREKWLTVIIGWTFIVLGIAGLFLPLLQGILFLMIGLIILSSEYAWAHGVLERIEHAFREWPRASMKLRRRPALG